MKATALLQKTCLPILILIIFCQTSHSLMSDCYRPDRRPQRCLPPFVNAAFGKTVVASNTCGTPAERYCVQTGVTGVTHSCHECDSRIPTRSHGTEFLTDLNEDNVPTWWQSSTMLQEIQYPNMVNLTLNLHKAFDITYVRLRFHTSRPESFAIYKKRCEDCEWQPFQYYSGSCFSTYHIDNKEIVTVENEQKALCTDDYSDISPLTGGNVAFSTLESRPSAYNFDRSQVLQDWVRAVAIRITLNRINTFGDEVFNDPKILQSYYYGISDLSIGGRCTCNGHASRCLLGDDGYLACHCEHNTAGRDCERCADMFNDRLWARGTRDNAAECLPCDCNGMAETCYFDLELYRNTGHGGHCSGCRDNTDGPHCEFCRSFFYRDENGRCVDCECSATGSYNQQCDENGRCRCKPGVTGPTCNVCLEGHYGLSEGGCRICGCSPSGTLDGTECDPISGACVCKLNVEGRLCDRCKPATMNLQASNPYGCTSCFCFGHSSVCRVSDDYTVAYIVSEFTNETDGWTGSGYYGDPNPVFARYGKLSMRSDQTYLYFVAPGKYLGEQRFSYNQFLEFELSMNRNTGAYGGPQPSRDDLILEGHGLQVSTNINSQGNPVPSSSPHLYKFRLHEAAGFYPQLSPLDFQKMLNNLTRIRIRSSYVNGLVAQLDNVRLTTAVYRGSGPSADWVESCYAEGYDGQFSNQCAFGFTRDPPNGGVYAPCVPCVCNNHARTCDPNTGVCDCLHNTMGEHCELCNEGFYFSGDESKRGTPLECLPCPCPDRSACVVIEDGSVVCTNCPPGHVGKLCEICMDGWFGDPRGRGPCLRCMCNGNIDENAIMNCDRMTGECLKCIHNTTGFHCEHCLDGYFGSPTSQNPAEQCQLCGCNSLGSNHITSCNFNSGQCDCLPNVEGRQCEQCRRGFWNIASGFGCESCNCNQIGTSTGECDQDSGQCICLPGVSGLRCDRCLPNYYGLSRSGCTACDCNPEGSISLQCDQNGICVCRDGVYGRKCDRCQENYYDLANGCIVCPTCYGLVQDAVNDHRSQLKKLEDMIDAVDQLPTDNDNNADFVRQLNELNETAYELLDRALDNQEKWGSLVNQFNKTIETLKEMLVQITNISEKFDQCNQTFKRAKNLNADAIDDTDIITNILNSAQQKLNQAMNNLTAAQKLAEENLNKENNMSKLAQEATALAKLHETVSKDIVDTAQLAYNTSLNASLAIQSAINLLEELLTKLHELIEIDSKIPAARMLRDELLAQSGKVLNATNAALNESTVLVTEAMNLDEPKVDTDSINLKSQDVLSAVEEMIPKLDELDQEYKTNYAELTTEVDKARELLDLAKTAERTAALLLAQADSALHDGLDAVARGKTAYIDVLELIETLESFEDSVSGKKQDALDALANADAIRDKINEANGITNETKSILGEARSIAEEASDKATQAANIAEMVASIAKQVKQEASKSHKRAIDLSEMVDDLRSHLVTIGQNLTEAEDKVYRDSMKVADAKTAARKAKSSADAAKIRVDDVLKLLEDFLKRLQNEMDVDFDEIERLESKYETLRMTFVRANVEEIVNRMEVLVNKQTLLFSSYKNEIIKLTADVENLSLINATLPSGCANVEETEQA